MLNVMNTVLSSALVLGMLPSSAFAAGHVCKLIKKVEVYNTASGVTTDETVAETKEVAVPDGSRMGGAMVELKTATGEDAGVVKLFTLGADRSAKEPRVGANAMFEIEGMEESLVLMMPADQDEARETKYWNKDLEDAAGGHSNWIETTYVTLTCYVK